MFPPDKESLEISTFLLIRYVTTEFNVEHQKVLKDFGETGEEFRVFRGRRDLVDPPLN